VQYTPAAAVVTVDGVVVSPVSEHYAKIPVTPGTHEVSVSMKGFAEHLQVITLEDGDWYPVYALLESNSAETRNYYDNHVNDQVAFEGLNWRRMTGLGEVSEFFPMRGYGFEAVLKNLENDDPHVQVTCHIDVISRQECKTVVRSTLADAPYLLDASDHVFVFIDN